MLKIKGRYFVIAAVVLIFALTLSVNAQSRELTAGQPVFAEITAENTTLSFSYSLAQLSYVTFQALSESIQPTFTIFFENEILARHANPEGMRAVELEIVLSAGNYTVEVSSIENTTGSVLVLVSSEVPVPVQTLLPGAATGGTLSLDVPAMVYNFAGLPEQAYLFIDSEADDAGIAFRLIDLATMQTSASSGEDVLGTRLRLPASTGDFQLEVAYNGAAETIAYNLCLIPVRDGTCTSAAEEVTAVVGCFVTPATASGANIRQSADQNASILMVLPAGATASVQGIAPGGSYYNVRYTSVTGWTAAIAVTTNGTCSNLTVINPPPVAVVPPPPPPPTDSAPPPPPPASPVPSGPCLITITAPTYVYVIPVADISNLYDQTMSGYELIPNGRLADNSWWRTNYGPSWIETSHFGVTAVVTGDCSGLPIVSP